MIKINILIFNVASLGNSDNGDDDGNSFYYSFLLMLPRNRL